MTSKQETRASLEQYDNITVIDYCNLKNLSSEFNYFVKVTEFSNSQFNQVIE